jgi:hypothetical protein
MATKKKDEAAALADKLLGTLEGQRALGPDSYPLTLKQLGERAEPQAPPGLLLKAAAKAAFGERAVVARKKDLAAPVALREDLAQLAASPLLLEFVLGLLCRPDKPLVPFTSLKTKVDALLREPFLDAVSCQISVDALPPTVGRRLVRGRWQLYLQRMPPPPPPRKPEVQLAEDLLQVLKAQRDRGGNAYPLALSELVRLTDPQAPAKRVKQALGKEPFKSQAVLAFPRQADTPLALAEDLDWLAGSPLLLEAVLRAARTANNQAFAPAGLKTKVAAALRQPFVDACALHVAAGTLPPAVGWMWIGKKQYLFLLKDVHPTPTGPISPPPSPPEPQLAAAPVDFEPAFDAAFQRLDRGRGGHNFVSLVDLRQAVQAGREAFDAGLRRLRIAGRYTLSAAEGRHGTTPEERAAGITEDGALLLYVSRKSVGPPS